MIRRFYKFCNIIHSSSNYGVAFISLIPLFLGWIWSAWLEIMFAQKLRHFQFTFSYNLHDFENMINTSWNSEPSASLLVMSSDKFSIKRRDLRRYVAEITRTVCHMTGQEILEP